VAEVPGVVKPSRPVTRSSPQRSVCIPDAPKYADEREPKPEGSSSHTANTVTCVSDMKRCPECGRGGRGSMRLSAPALLTLAARDFADGDDLGEETLPQLLLLLRELRAAEQTIEERIAHVTSLMAAGA
jgi:hypothetical protein